MTWCMAQGREADLGAVQDIQSTYHEQRIYDWWDRLGIVWYVAGGEALREVHQQRRLRKAMNAGTLHMVSEDGWRLLCWHTREDLTQQ